MHLKIRKGNTKILLFVLLMLLGQKIAIKVLGFEISIAIIAFPIFIFDTFQSHECKVNKKELLIYLILFCTCLIGTLINANFVFTSLIYFLLIYFLFCFDFDLKQERLMYMARLIRTVLLISAVLGILQFAVQFIGLGYFDPYDYLPENLKLSGFNTYYSMVYGSPIMKANGLIYLEPSFFSQFMAIAIILETVCFQKDKKYYVRIAIYLTALISSFSGTGIVVLLIGAIPAFMRLSTKAKMFVGALVVVILAIFINSGYSEFVFGRRAEFSISTSSGAIRFINPYIVTFSQKAVRLFLGNGAGLADSLSQNSFLTVNNNAITKIILEYGIINCVIFIIFLIKKYFRFGINIISICLLIMFLLLGGNLLQPSMSLLFLVLNEVFGNRMIKTQKVLNTSYQHEK